MGFVCANDEDKHDQRQTSCRQGGGTEARLLSTPSTPREVRLMKDPRIAVCISGALRTFPACAPSIRSFFGDVDYYGTFWSWDRDKFPSDGAASLLPFKAVDFPDQPSVATPPAPKLKLKNINIIPMLLGMQMNFEFFRQCVGDISTYDLVFRCRPDLLFQGNISEFLEAMVESKVYFPSHSQFQGYCDQFAGGPPRLMETVFSTYRAIASYDGEQVTLNAEGILKYWVDRHGIDACELPFEFKICRHAFVGTAYQEIPRDSTEFRVWTPNDPSRR